MNWAGGAVGGTDTLRFTWGTQLWYYTVGDYMILWLDTSSPVSLTTATVVGYNGGTVPAASDTASIPNLSPADNVPINIVWTGPAPGTPITDVDLFITVSIGDSVRIDAVSNPEPGTLALFGTGLLGFVAWGLRRRKNRK